MEKSSLTLTGTAEDEPHHTRIGRVWNSASMTCLANVDLPFGLVCSSEPVFFREVVVSQPIRNEIDAKKITIDLIIWLSINFE